MSNTFPTGDHRCPICGMWNPAYLHSCGGSYPLSNLPPVEYGRYHFTLYVPTLEDIRKIVREEIERAAADKTETLKGE